MLVDFTIRVPGGITTRSPRWSTLEGLVDDLLEDDFYGELAYRPPLGGGFSPEEVTLLYLGMKFVDVATGSIVDRLVGALVERVKIWIQRQERPNQAVKLYGPDGKPLLVIRRDAEGVHEDDPEQT